MIWKLGAGLNSMWYILPVSGSIRRPTTRRICVVNNRQQNYMKSTLKRMTYERRTPTKDRRIPATHQAHEAGGSSLRRFRHLAWQSLVAGRGKTKTNTRYHSDRRVKCINEAVLESVGNHLAASRETVANPHMSERAVRQGETILLDTVGAQFLLAPMR